VPDKYGFTPIGDIIDSVVRVGRTDTEREFLRRALEYAYLLGQALPPDAGAKNRKGMDA
jgi:hypothetical protein